MKQIQKTKACKAQKSCKAQKKQRRIVGSMRESAFIFFGILFVCAGFFLLIIETNLIPLTVSQAWPIIMAMTGASLLAAGFYRYRRLVGVYVVPATLIIVLGLFFMLFSFDIITMPLRTFAAMWWPLLFVLAGIGLLATFFYIQHTKKAVLEDDEDYYNEDFI